MECDLFNNGQYNESYIDVYKEKFISKGLYFCKVGSIFILRIYIIK